MASRGSASSADASSPPPESAREELARILDSAEFPATPQRRKMLRYLVDEMLAGRSQEIKGYTIAVNVLGRDESFDAHADPVVRLEARRLRHDLDSYYVSAGRSNPLRISIPKGRYVPKVSVESPAFAWPDQPDEAAAPIAGIGGDAGTKQSSTWRWYLAAISLAGFVVFAMMAPMTIKGWLTDSDSNEASLQSPAVAVMPFDVLSINEDDEFLAVGISDRVLNELSRFPDIRIYSPGVKALANTAQLGEEMGGVFYFVRGSVRSEGQSLSIAARLVDARTSEVVWSDSYEHQMEPNALLHVQSEIAANIASTLGQPYGVIRFKIAEQVSDEFAPSMRSYECVLRGYVYRRNFAAEQHAPVMACLERAVRQEPNYAEAWAMLGWLYLDAGRFGLVKQEGVEIAYDKALDAASHALTLDGTDVLALKALSSINHYMGNYDEGERFARQALDVNPNDPDTLAQLGWRLAVRGKFEEGIPYLQRAIKRTVNAPGWYYHLIAVDHYMQGRYAEMLSAAKRGTVDGSAISWSFAAVAYGALGNEGAAKEALARMAEVSPLLGRDPANAYRRHGATQAIIDALVAGLRNAGWKQPSRLE